MKWKVERKYKETMRRNVKPAEVKERTWRNLIYLLISFIPPHNTYMTLYPKSKYVEMFNDPRTEIEGSIFIEPIDNGMVIGYKLYCHILGSDYNCRINYYYEMED